LPREGALFAVTAQRSASRTDLGRRRRAEGKPDLHILQVAGAKIPHCTGEMFFPVIDNIPAGK
jgi:hypothetical protein